MTRRTRGVARTYNDSKETTTEQIAPSGDQNKNLETNKANETEKKQEPTPTRTRTRTRTRNTNTTQSEEKKEEQKSTEQNIAIKLPDQPPPPSTQQGRPMRRREAAQNEEKETQKSEESKPLTAYELRRRGRDRKRQQEKTVSEFVDSEDGPPLIGLSSNSIVSQLKNEFGDEYSDDYIGLEEPEAGYDENYVFQIPKGQSTTVTFGSNNKS